VVHPELPEAIKVELPHEGPEVIVLEEGGEQVAERLEVFDHKGVASFGPSNDGGVRLLKFSS
jgi:hypothetical protein